MQFLVKAVGKMAALYRGYTSFVGFCSIYRHGVGALYDLCTYIGMRMGINKGKYDTESSLNVHLMITSLKFGI